MVRSAIQSLTSGQLLRKGGSPIPGLFEPIDATDMARRLSLASRGEKNGKRELPATDQTTHDDVEQDILQAINVVLTKQKADAVGTLKALRDMAASLGVSSQLAQLRLKAREARAKFIGAQADIGGDLAQKRSEFLQRSKELEEFRATHRLTRMPRKPSNSVLTFGLLFLFISVESLLNTLFFAKGSSLGLIGGFGTAVGISLLNVLAAFSAGAVFWRWSNHRSWIVKLLGILGIVIVLGALALLHLFSAHFRDAIASLGEERAFPAARASLLNSPFLLQDLHSYYLFGLGCFLALAAFAKGATSGDPYPGYWGVFRRARDAAWAYDDAYRSLFGELEDVRNEAVEHFETALVHIPQRASQAVQAQAQQATIIRNFASYEDHLEQCANRLLSVYYQENRANRKTPPPRRFNETWRISRGSLSDRVLATIGDGAPDSTEHVQDALSEIAQLQEDVLARYEELVTRADRPAAILDMFKA